MIPKPLLIAKALGQAVTAFATTYPKLRPLTISLGLDQDDDVDKAAERYRFKVKITNPAELPNSIAEWGCFGQGIKRARFGRMRLDDLDPKLSAFTEPAGFLAEQIAPIDTVDGHIVVPVVQPNTLDASEYRGLRFFFRPVHGSERSFHFILEEEGTSYWIPRPRGWRPKPPAVAA
ncbi:MAG: hypothetical protein DMD89_23450 [Candidatus Rokuibacteriota bacterium]|nr:MAG: hypothetical protein DMD89_23450 [Candidatus Rokubacteria bacterium]